MPAGVVMEEALCVATVCDFVVIGLSLESTHEDVCEGRSTFCYYCLCVILCLSVILYYDKREVCWKGSGRKVGQCSNTPEKVSSPAGDLGGQELAALPGVCAGQLFCTCLVWQLL